MRKYRGLRVDGGGWVYGGYMRHKARTPAPIGDKLKPQDIQHLILNSGFSDWNMPKPIEAVPVIPETVGQYTGKETKDTHKKIYKGDICKLYQHTAMYEVKWDSEKCYFYYQCLQTDEIRPMTIPATEIIGNIHELTDERIAKDGEKAQAL